MSPVRFSVGSALASFMILGAAMPNSAIAQEYGTVPGAIPDPSTYQGSTELQQQSDAQDQQFRAQQEQAAQQQQQSYEYYQNSNPPRQPAQPQQRYTPNAQRQTPKRGASAGVSSDPAMAAIQRADYVSAFRLLRPQALRGDAWAEYNLGHLYDQGLGVARDAGQAATWYRKAADQGFPQGQAEMGRLYYQGAGVPRDLAESYKWLVLAARRSPAAAHNMELLRPILTYSQMAEGFRRAQSWVPVATPPPATPAARKPVSKPRKP